MRREPEAVLCITCLASLTGRGETEFGNEERSSLMSTLHTQLYMHNTEMTKKPIWKAKQGLGLLMMTHNDINQVHSEQAEIYLISNQLIPTR